MIAIHIGSHAIAVREQAIEIAIDAVVVFHRSLEIHAEAGNAVSFLIHGNQAGEMECYHIGSGEHSSYSCYVEQVHNQHDWTSVGQIIHCHLGYRHLFLLVQGKPLDFRANNAYLWFECGIDTLVLDRLNYEHGRLLQDIRAKRVGIARRD